MRVRNAPYRRTQQVHASRRTVEKLDQESKRQRTRGDEAPMVIWPPDVAKLFRQLLTTIRGTFDRF